MQLTNIFVSFLLAGAVSAKGGSKNGTQSVKAQCNDVAKLQKQIALAGNDTKLAEKFKDNQTAIDAFKAKTADKQTQLNTLSSNTTLMDACQSVFAQEAMVGACAKMALLEKSIALAANDTKLNDKFKGNTTKIDAFKAKASAAPAMLATMSGNTTLTDFCSVQQTKEQCKVMSQLQKEQAMASNTTALQTKFDGNQTKIDKFTAKAAKSKAKLDALMGNSTLMDTCSTLTKAGTTNAASSGDSTKAASPAGRIEAAGGMITAAVLAVTAAMMIL